MARVSNAVIVILNVGTLLISLGAVGASVYFRLHSTTDCQKVLQTPLLILGAAMFVVSVLGLIGSWCKVNWVMGIYLFVLFLLMTGVLVFAIFCIVVTNKGVGSAVSGMGFKEYRLGDYSHWLQKHVVSGKNWDEIRSCLIDAKVCDRLAEDFKDKNASDFFKNNLSPIQSGCCKPPSYCGFGFKNATYWTAPKSGPVVADSDCTSWSNNQTELCYECKSCKAGILDNIRKEWRNFAILNFCVFVFISIVYYTASCARTNNKYDSSKYSKYSRGYP